MSANHATIGHNWAHELKEHQGDDFFHFNGTIIYSYDTAIGEIVYTKNDIPVYFLNTGSCSNSTSKHQGHTFNAIPNDAVVFSASCDEFIFNWTGMTNHNNELTEYNASIFMLRNLQAVFDKLVEFKVSKALKIEKEFSLLYFDEAVRFYKYFPLVSLSKILRMTNWMLNVKGITKPTEFRKVVKAIMAGNRELKSLVDIANGDGTYDAYYDRTKGIRVSETTRLYNYRCGFNTTGFRDDWYDPYQYDYSKKNGSRFPANYTFISRSLKSCDEKGFSFKQILQYRKQGNLVEVLFKAKKDNFDKACQKLARDQRCNRIKKAKLRLEKHIGLRGWVNNYNSYGKPLCRSFNYNGTVYTFHPWNEEVQLTDDEYCDFSHMSPEERTSFIHEKRAEMLETLREQDYSHEHRQEIAAQAYQKWLKEQEEKREYIDSLKAKGNEGLRQLWHEGLVTGSSLWNMGTSLFYGGNVLLRVDDKGNVQTSKGIVIPRKECERLWKVINFWHINNVEFDKSDEVAHATNHSWNIQRYHNDIMIAGCHAIAYTEMKTIAQQLNFC